MNTYIQTKANLTSKEEYEMSNLKVDMDKDYFAEYIFADTKLDLDNEEIPQEILNTKVNGMKGDLEHSRLNDLEGFDKSDLFEVVDSFYQGDKLFGKVKFNKNHKQFKPVWYLNTIGKFGISPEYNRKVSNNKYLDLVGVTGTINPRNPRSKVINAFAI